MIAGLPPPGAAAWWALIVVLTAFISWVLTKLSSHLCRGYVFDTLEGRTAVVMLFVHLADTDEGVVSQSVAEIAAFAAKQESLYLNSSSLSVAQLAAGAVMAVTEAVVRGESRNGMAVVRPPGHHAEAHMAMGFCVFKNEA